MKKQISFKCSWTEIWITTVLISVFAVTTFSYPKPQVDRGKKANTTATQLFNESINFHSVNNLLKNISGKNFAQKQGNIFQNEVFSTKLDRISPQIVINSPVSNTTVSGIIKVSASASHNFGVVGVQFKLDGNNLDVEKTISPYGISWDTNNIRNGHHVLTAVVRDKSQNSTVSASVYVFVNNVMNPPVISSFTVSSNQILAGQSTLLSWSVSGAATLTINQGIGTVDGNNISVSPTVTTIYTLTASNASGVATATKTISVISPPPPPAANFKCSWYIDTNGSKTNSGASDSPWNLAYALSGAEGKIRPGNTVCLMGGTYPGRYIASLTGTANQPIVVRAYPGQRAVIDGGLPITVLSQPTGTAGAYTNGSIMVADTTSLQENTTVRIGSEVIRVDRINSQTGFVNVVRGWSGSCSATGICESLPTGESVKAYNNIFETSGSSYLWIWGLEITNSGHNSRVSYRLDASDVDAGNGLVDGCSVGCKYINNVVHNAANGIGSFANENGSEFYGNLTFLNGWEGASGGGDRGKGHGMYLQNLTASAPVKKVTDNLSLLNFGFAMQAYTDQGGIYNLQFQGNTFFESGNPVSSGPTFNLLIGGGNAPFRGAKFIENYTYTGIYNGVRRGTDVIGWGDTPCVSPEIRDNFFASAYFSLSVNCTNASIARNTFYSSFGLAGLFTDNVYYHSRPSEIKIFVRPNEYEPGRGNITVYNWLRSNSVSVNISLLRLNIGQRFEVRDTQNYNGLPVLSGTYNGEEIVIPMSATSVSPVYGTVIKQPTHTDREFGAFVVVPVY